MSEEKKEEKPKEGDAKKGGGGSTIVIVAVAAAVAAGGAAFGGAKLAGKNASASPAHHVAEAKPPGPTMALEPFVLTLSDKDGKSHAMRLALALEFDSHAKEDELKKLVPRVRDATLTYIRTLTFEMMADPASLEKTRAALLEKIQKVGAPNAEKVLITDLVLQ